MNDDEDICAICGLPGALVECPECHELCCEDCLPDEDSPCASCRNAIESAKEDALGSND
jgi:hypothetical protein